MLEHLRCQGRFTACGWKLGLGLMGLFASAALPAQVAYAFAEDLCFDAQGVYGAGPVIDCLPVPVQCDPDLGEDYDSVSCQLATIAAAIGNVPGRSTIHVDATYYIAQALGLDRTSAYWLVAYNEAVDLGIYVPYDEQGEPLVSTLDDDENLIPDVCEVSDPPDNCAYLTKRIDGVNRGNFADGGIFFHFHAPHHGLDTTPLPGLDGLAPDPTDAETEVMLANLRRWAFGKGPACTGGLTEQTAAGDYATGAGCFTRASGEPGEIHGELAALAQVAVPINSVSGLQVISNFAGQVRSDDFDTYIGEHAVWARLGIYLHAVQDRVSHHRCIDVSVLTGPYPEGADFVATMTGNNCNQINHAARHAWETGVDPDNLHPRDRTTPAALELTWNELSAWLQDHGQGVEVSSRRMRMVLGALNGALAQDGAARLTGLVRAGCSLGYEPLPGHGSCADLEF